MKDRNEPPSRFEQMSSKHSMKKYRYYFFDYLYYRLYVTYKKHDDPPRFSACCAFAGTFMIAQLFLSIAASCIFADFFFSRKRTAAILLKYKGNQWNRIIPSWIIWTFPIGGFLAGIGICRLIFN